MKKIIYMGPMEFPDKNAAAQRVLNISKILSELGYEVILIGYSRQLNLMNNTYHHTKVGGFECYEYPYPETKRNWFNKVISTKEFELVFEKHNPEDIEAVILYNYYSIASMRIKKILSKFNVKVISDITEWYSNSKNIFKNIDNFFRMRFVNLKMDANICISKYLEKYYRERKCKIAYIPAIVDSQNTKWNNCHWERPSYPRVISYVGSPGIREGKDRLDIIVESFKKVREKNIKYLLNIVGINKEDFLKFYPNYSKYNFEDINFYGKVNHDIALNIIKKSDYTIFFRGINRVTTAGFPTKLGESFACGVPVITNSTSDIPDFLIDEENGFIAQSFDIESLVETIEKALLIDDEKLTEMHTSCRIKNMLDVSNYYNELGMLFD